MLRLWFNRPIIQIYPSLGPVAPKPNFVVCGSGILWVGSFSCFPANSVKMWVSTFLLVPWENYQLLSTRAVDHVQRVSFFVLWTSSRGCGVLIFWWGSDSRVFINWYSWLRLLPLKISRLRLRVKVRHRLLKLCDCDNVLSEWCRLTN